MAACTPLVMASMWHIGKHFARNFAVKLGDTVDVIAQAQSEISHVERGTALGRFLKIGVILLDLEDILDQVGRGRVFHIEKANLVRK